MNLQKLNPWNWFKHEEPENVTVHHPSAPVSQSNQYQGNQHPVTRLQQEFDRMFNDLFNVFSHSSSSSRSQPAMDDFFRPDIDISGSEKNYEIKLDVPGLEAKDLTIDVQNDALVIRGQVHQEEESKDKHFYRMERRYGAFQRTLALPEDADHDEIAARLNNGVLKLTIPRKDIPVSENSKRIPID